MSLSQEQLDRIAIAARVSSALSLLGVFAIIGTFSLSRFFRSPIHRIIFYIAFYNLVGTVATMITVSGPNAGNTSSLCRFQAFALQMFPLADVLWTFVMALDVYLVVFHHFDGRALKRLEIFYAVTITVLTFIPALVFLFIHTSARGPVYDGSAIIWCAIGVNWTLLRLLIYYVPAWITIVVIMLVYCFVGIKIWILHSDIQLASDDYIPQATSSTTSQRSNKTTCTINTNITATTVESQGPNEPRRSADLREIATQPPLELSSIPRLPTPVQPTPPRQRRLSFRQYILIPMLFFFALLATWVAPTVYRVYLFGQPDYVSYSLLMVVSALTSLRGFFNAIIFLTMGMKGRRRRISECPRAAMASDNRLNP